MSKLIPKKIGSVKVPKKLRRFGNNTLSDPKVRELAIAGLGALGGILADRSTRPGTVVGEAIRHPLETMKSAGDTARDKVTSTASNLAASAALATFAPVVASVMNLLRGHTDSSAEGRKARTRTKRAKSARNGTGKFKRTRTASLANNKNHH